MARRVRRGASHRSQYKRTLYNTPLPFQEQKHNVKYIKTKPHPNWFVIRDRTEGIITLDPKLSGYCYWNYYRGAPEPRHEPPGEALWRSNVPRSPQLYTSCTNDGGGWPCGATTARTPRLIVNLTRHPPL